ncbi:hypothetical protein PBI_SCTP2_358 [Salicola phage SCTP-2]|nr:hypothetical protein PBI_SCTP2_358 [Salicola phage SCTP-2]
MIDLIKSLIKDWKNKRLYSDPRKLHYAQLREHNKERGVEHPCDWDYTVPSLDDMIREYRDKGY